MVNIILTNLPARGPSLMLSLVSPLGSVRPRDGCIPMADPDD